MGRRVGQRVGGHPLGVAVRLTPVPQQLDDVEYQWPRFFVGVARIQQFCELVEVDRAWQEDRVVHRRHAERRAREVGGHRRQRPAHDAALAVAVVVQVMRVQRRGRVQCSVLVEGFVGRKAGRADHRAAEVELVEQPLLQAVGELWELREVLRRRNRRWQVRQGHADLIGRALDDVVPLGEAALWTGGDLARFAEQAVAV